MTDEDQDRTWLVFTNQTDFKALYMLKSGFRHCFVVMKKDGQWLSIDPMAHFTEVTMQECGIVKYLDDLNYQIIEVPNPAILQKAAPPMILTCVEVCKRLLGIHKITILTPWQLYRHVQKMNNRKGNISWEA